MRRSGRPAASALPFHLATTAAATVASASFCPKSRGDRLGFGDGPVDRCHCLQRLGVIGLEGLCRFSGVGLACQSAQFVEQHIGALNLEPGVVELALVFVELIVAACQQQLPTLLLDFNHLELEPGPVDFRDVSADVDGAAVLEALRVQERHTAFLFMEKSRPFRPFMATKRHFAPWPGWCAGSSSTATQSEPSYVTASPRAYLSLPKTLSALK
jgi:hypothetical protein